MKAADWTKAIWRDDLLPPDAKLFREILVAEIRDTIKIMKESEKTASRRKDHAVALRSRVCHEALDNVLNMVGAGEDE